MINRVRDKIEFFNELKRLNLPFPESKIIHTLNDGKKAAQDLGFPLILKPLTGFGGRAIRKVKDKKALREFLTANQNRKWLMQRYVSGIPASISLLASRNKSRILAVTEQLLGIEVFGQRKEFTYCGNIVPLDVNTHLNKQCKEVAEKVAKCFRLEGSNGIDIIVSKKDEKVMVIEVNPRFQGSMECVENYLGINLVEKHMHACLQGEIPKITSHFASSYYSRAILYAKSRYHVPDLTSLDFVRDIPKTGCIINSGDPICSVITHASSRKKCVDNFQRYADLIYRKCLR
jgi:predicted ATP-grasp superfamily ATP-dependent carboligase